MSDDALKVASLAEALRVWPDFDAVISIEDANPPEGERRSFEFGRTDGSAPVPAHLRLLFDDLDEIFPGYAIPTADDVDRALEFARVHAGRRLLVHCHAGQCRSAGVALGVIAERLGAGRETDAVAHLLRIRPVAAPNLIVLDLVDAALGRGGALRNAWMRHEECDEKLLRMRFLRQAYYATSPSPS